MGMKFEKATSKRECLVTPWYYGLHLSFVWLPDTHLYPNPLFSSSVYFPYIVSQSPLYNNKCLKQRPQNTMEQHFINKNIDFIGTAPILRHSCPIVFSMIFALRTYKQTIICRFRDFLHIVFCIVNEALSTSGICRRGLNPKLEYATLKP